KSIGDLDQDPGAVAHERVRAHRAAVVEVHQDLEAGLDHLVGFAALDIGHEAHAARVMLVRRIVQTLPEEPHSLVLNSRTRNAKRGPTRAERTASRKGAHLAGKWEPVDGTGTAPRQLSCGASA